jgi:MFS transporter, ACS family, D-galactonate transporter
MVLGFRSRFRVPALIGLLGVAIVINYMDRGSLSVAAPMLKNELHLTATQIGIVITAFFWTYTFAIALSGWIVDRFDVGRVLAAGFLLWSLATSITGLVHGIVLLIAVRMLLGAAESVAFPACCKIVAITVPAEHRGVANAVIMTGLSLGPAVGAYVCGTFMGLYGWRPVFLAIGLLSLLWLIPWLQIRPRTEPVRSKATSAGAMLVLLRKRDFWATSLGHLCLNYAFYFMFVWLPLYLVRERHRSNQQMTLQTTLFFAVFAVCAPIAGWAADTFVRTGKNSTFVRKAFMFAGMAMVSIGVLACGAISARLSLIGLVVMAMGFGIATPNIYVFVQALAGPQLAGKWAGLQNCIANLAGILVGPLTGWSVDHTGTFRLAIAICAAVAALGAMPWVLLLGNLEELRLIPPSSNLSRRLPSCEEA